MQHAVSPTSHLHFIGLGTPLPTPSPPLSIVVSQVQDSLSHVYCLFSIYPLSLCAGLHEDLERLERVIVKDYKQDAKSHKEKLMQNHRVRKRIDDMQTIANKLVSPAEAVC